MGPDILIPMIVIGGLYATIIAVKALNVEALKYRRGDSDRVAAELAALRQEIADLKTWAGSLILSFDSTLQQHDARLHSVERRGLNPIPGRGEARPEREALEPRSHV